MPVEGIIGEAGGGDYVGDAGRARVPLAWMSSSAASSSRRTSLAYSAPRLDNVRSAIRAAMSRLSGIAF